MGELAGFRIRINKRRQCSAGEPGGRQLPPDSRVQRGQHDGEAIGIDAATSLRTKSMDGHTRTAISGEVVASRSLVTS